MNKMLVKIIILCCFALGTSLSASSEGVKEFAAKLTVMKGTTPAQWRLIWTGDAAREVTVSWSTADAGKTHRVYYSEKALGANWQKYPAFTAAHRNGQYTLTKRDKKSKVSAAYYHHVRLKGLKPSTKYYFVIVSDGLASRPFYFKTAPASGVDFSIIHGGDSRSGLLARCQINEKIADETQKNSKVLAFAHGGDYVVKGTWALWRLWLSQHELTTAADGRVLPLIPTRGNHDGGPNYKEIFDILPDQNDWHTTSMGSDVAMVTLDTNVSAGGEQSKWLEGELKRLRPEVKWLLTQYHRPLYPAVKTVPQHASFFCPLFDKYEVDLACEADGHCIKRTVPIRDGKAHPDGVVYIGEGGLGVGQRKPDVKRWYLKEGVYGSEHHYMVLDFNKDALRIQTILLDGKVFDDYSIK